MFAASGVMQGSLLVMCLVWKSRQRSLGIDDFGKPLLKSPSDPHEDDASLSHTSDDAEHRHTHNATEETPLLAGSSAPTVSGKKKKWWSPW
jgi:hypothetical protein